MTICQGRSPILSDKKKLKIIVIYERMKRAPNFKKGTYELQKGKKLTEYPCLNAIFELFRLKKFFSDF